MVKKTLKMPYKVLQNILHHWVLLLWSSLCYASSFLNVWTKSFEWYRSCAHKLFWMDKQTRATLYASHYVCVGEGGLLNCSLKLFQCFLLKTHFQVFFNLLPSLFLYALQIAVFLKNMSRPMCQKRLCTQCSHSIQLGLQIWTSLKFRLAYHTYKLLFWMDLDFSILA